MVELLHYWWNCIGVVIIGILALNLAVLIGIIVIYVVGAALICLKFYLNKFFHWVKELGSRNA